MVVVGNAAPKFVVGGRQYPASNSILAFYKVSCPTCKLTLPYLHRADRAVIGIAQDNLELTADFEKRFEVRISSVIDEAASGYKTSNTYGIEYVPTMFVIDENGIVTERIEGFNREALEDLGIVFDEKEAVPIYKPG